MADPPASLKSRRSIRLRDYDYSSDGAYFITVCTRGHECLLASIAGEHVSLNPVGSTVEQTWQDTETIRPNIVLDAFVVMPNHFHGILFIAMVPVSTGSPSRQIAGTGVLQPPTGATTAQHRQLAQGMDRPRHQPPMTSPSGTLGAIIRGFKASVTSQVRTMRDDHHFVLWQRNYHEHVIRNEAALNRIREYIDNNPRKWAEDRFFRDTM